MTGRDLTHAHGMIDFIDASPSPYHAVATTQAMLEAVGFGAVGLDAPFPAGGRHLVTRGGTIVAWCAPPQVTDQTVFHLVGAHTDSPNLRLKPNAELSRSGFRQLGVEVYGGPLLNSWLDRDLGLCGRVVVRDGGGTDVRLLRIDRPLLRIPQLAIHLDREINEKGLLLNRQQHLAPFWATDRGDDVTVAEVIGEAVGVAASDVIAADVMVHPIEGGRVVGLRDEFVSSARIDNQLSCYAGVQALTAANERPDRVAVLVLFDHEEVGSASDRGADGGFLSSVLERVWLAAGGARAGFLRALAAGACISADCAHATNPNYADRHEPSHTIALNGGPVLKVNSNLRYATDAETAAVFAEACRAVDVPLQRFVNRTDLACGSTIGPLTASALGIPTVDVGAPQLAMHSARELCGTDDVGMLVAALRAFLA